MYSVVLMAALTGGTSDTAWCLRSYGCHGCHGCHCGCACGWCGCGGWCGHGGYCAHFAAYPPIGNGYSFCDFCGCYAGYGNGWYRGYGNGYGLGYANGYGFGHGNGYWCHGCYCGCFNSIGCYCGHSCWGAPPGVVVPPVGSLPPPKTKEKEKNGGKEEENTARVVINVPADAKLYIDGQLMKSGSSRRVFATPTLRPGQAYFYDIKAETVRDGQPVSRTQRVYLRVGDVVTASFDELRTATASARTEE